MKVKIDTKTFRFDKLITGQIWIDLNDSEFPSKYWSEFPIIILNWWLENLILLTNNNQTSCMCNFMDGPYSFEVIVESDSKWKIYFMKSDSKEDFCQFQMYLQPQELLGEILESEKNIIEFCKRNDWESKEIENLRNSVASYQN